MQEKKMKKTAKNLKKKLANLFKILKDFGIFKHPQVN